MRPSGERSQGSQKPQDDGRRIDGGRAGRHDKAHRPHGNVPPALRRRRERHHIRRGPDGHNRPVPRRARRLISPNRNIVSGTLP